MHSWYALYTKPHKENSLEKILSLRGITTYLPMLPKVQHGRCLDKMEPLFPCYLFAKLDLDVIGLGSLRWTPGLRDIVSGAEGPARVDEAIIDHLKMRLTEKDILRSAAHDRFKPNEPIRLKGSLFDDLAVVFERYLPGAARARVLVHILGRATSVDVAVEMMQKASNLK